jgi:hypothetical protein
MRIFFAGCLLGKAFFCTQTTESGPGPSVLTHTSTSAVQCIAFNRTIADLKGKSWRMLQVRNVTAGRYGL